MPASAAPARPRLRTRTLVALATVVALSAACIGTSPTSQTIRADVPRRSGDEDLVAPTVAAANGFALDLYRATAADQSGNFVATPFAVMLALGQARAGAAGTTRSQFDAVLHAAETPDLDGGLATLDQLVESRSGERSSAVRKGRVITSLDASTWGQRGTRFTPTYLESLASTFGAPVHVVDFHTDPEGARDAINRWGTEVTQERITDLVARGDVTSYTRFLPVAVTYLRAPWEVPFARAATRTSSFERLDGTTSDVRSMQVRAPNGLRAGEGPGWTAVDIPYLGDELSLLVVVPDEGAFDQVQSSFDRALLDQVDDRLGDDPVDLRLPMFQFTSSGNLADRLESLGLTDAFSRQADFSGVTTDELLSLSGTLFQGYIGVDEEGTDAATTADASATVEPTPGAERITVDRPFLFAVRDRETGLILLVGRVVDPN